MRCLPIFLSKKKSKSYKNTKNRKKKNIFQKGLDKRV